MTLTTNGDSIIISILENKNEYAERVTVSQESLIRAVQLISAFQKTKALELIFKNQKG